MSLAPDSFALPTSYCYSGGKCDVLMAFTDITCIPNCVRLTTVVEKPRGGTGIERDDRQTDTHVYCIMFFPFKREIVLTYG